MIIVWFLLGVLSTIGTEIAALMGAVHTAQADVEAARTGFAQTFADLGTRLDQIFAAFQLPF
jgi:hypothetical protein